MRVEKVKMYVVCDSGYVAIEVDKTESSDAGSSVKQQRALCRENPGKVLQNNVLWSFVQVVW